MLSSQKAWVSDKWFGELFHISRLDAGQRFVLGGAKSCFAFPEVWLGTSELTLVDFRDNAFVLCPPNEPSERLGPSQRKSVQLGPFCFIVNVVFGDDGAPAVRRPWGIARSFYFLCGSIAAHALALVGLAFSVPPLHSEEPKALQHDVEFIASIRTASMTAWSSEAYVVSSAYGDHEGRLDLAMDVELDGTVSGVAFRQVQRVSEEAPRTTCSHLWRPASEHPAPGWPHSPR